MPVALLHNRTDAQSTADTSRAHRQNGSSAGSTPRQVITSITPVVSTHPQLASENAWPAGRAHATEGQIPAIHSAHLPLACESVRALSPTYATDGCPPEFHLPERTARSTTTDVQAAVLASRSTPAPASHTSVPRSHEPNIPSPDDAADANPPPYTPSKLTPTPGRPRDARAARPKTPPSEASLEAMIATATERLELWETIRRATLATTFKRAGVMFPRISAAGSSSASTNAPLNKPLQAAMSEYVRRSRPSFQEFVELVRGQTAEDYRPNKALIPAVLAQRCHGYQQLDELVVIAEEGVKATLSHAMPRQTRFPRNHPSASKRLNILRANIRREQDAFRCIVVGATLIEIWPELYVSPFGVVDKGDGDPLTSGRIHDLSYPENGSVNFHTDQATVPRAAYEHCSSICGGADLAKIWLRPIAIATCAQTPTNGGGPPMIRDLAACSVHLVYPSVGGLRSSR